MKAPIKSSELGISALTSLLFIILCVTLGRLIGSSFVPTTIEDFIVLYLIHFVFSITFFCLKNLRRKSTAPLDDNSENGNIK